MERKTLSVTGMSCNGCEQNVKNALQGLDGVSRVEADHEADTVDVVVDDAVTDDDLAAAIDRAGYDATHTVEPLQRVFDVLLAPVARHPGHGERLSLHTRR